MFGRGARVPGIGARSLALSGRTVRRAGPVRNAGTESAAASGNIIARHPFKAQMMIATCKTSLVGNDPPVTARLVNGCN